MTYQAYNGAIGIQSVGAIVLTEAELSDNMLVAVVNAGPQLTVTTIGALRTYLNGTLYNDGGVLTVSAVSGWGTTGAGPPGTLWSNGSVDGSPGVATVVPGYVPVSAPPVYFGQISAGALLAMGAFGLPIVAPPPGSLQLWVLNDEILVA